MKFRTEIESISLQTRIDHKSHIFAVGSCFADRIASRLSEVKISTTNNPFGVMFNPLSITSTIERADKCQLIDKEELMEGVNGYFHYDFHGSFSDSDKNRVYNKINRAIEEAHKALLRSDVVIITLGTSWVFTLGESDKVVANCHKQPSATFRRKMLSIETTAKALSNLAATTLHDKRIILTVSPIRHLADGLTANSLSKASLRLAAGLVAERCDNVEYFPAYEIMNDDLRDYRFYEDDMVHPSKVATDYIWEKFKSAVFTPQTQTIAERISAIVSAAAHRPLHPDSEAYRTFCRRQIEAIDGLSEIDCDNERKKFAAVLQNL